MMAAAPLTLSASDLAALNVPGLPRGKREINRMRAQRGWRTVDGPRGTLLIDITSLDADARDQVIARLAARLKPADNGVATMVQDRRGAGRPRGTDFFTRHPDIATAVTAKLAVHAFSAPRVMELLAAHGLEPLPPMRTLQRFIAKIEREKAATLAALRDPDKSKSKYQLAMGRMDGAETYAHETWELDTTKADVMLADGRWMILGLIDRWSRRARYVVAPSESAQSVRALLLRVILEWGVIPARIIVDNGSGYINKTVMTACKMLEIEHKPCPPGSPERKPFVERMFGTFTRERAVLLDGFTGHNVAQAQQLRGRARKVTGKAQILGSMTSEDLQVALDNWTIGVYEARIHGGIGMAPLAKAMQSPVPATPAPSEDVVRLALTAFVGDLVVGKRGLRWKSGRYWHSTLAPWIGKPVHVRRHEDDLGELLVFDDDGNFLCAAVNHERSGLSEREFAMAARQHQRSHDKVAKAQLRDAMRRFPMEVARAAILRSDAEAAGKLVQFPTPAAQPKSTTQRAREILRPDASLAAPTVVALPQPSQRDDIAARVARAESILANHEDGHDVPATDLAWAQAFASGPAWLAFKMDQSGQGGERPVISLQTRRRNQP